VSKMRCQIPTCYFKGIKREIFLIIISIALSGITKQGMIIRKWGSSKIKSETKKSQSESGITKWGNKLQIGAGYYKAGQNYKIGYNSDAALNNVNGREGFEHTVKLFLPIYF